MQEWPDIVRQYSPLVRKTAYRLLGNHADAADCMQEVFISAIKWDRCHQATNWVGLLRRITICRAMDMLRGRLRRTERSFTPGDWTTVPCLSPGPAQSAEDRELAARLRQCLPQLPGAQAEVFCLVCIEELTSEEAAAHLGLTGANVRVLLHRARARLRDLLALSQTPAEG